MPWADLHPQLVWTLSSIFVLLALASLSTALLSWCYPEQDWTELRQRVRTWWLMAAVFAVALTLGRTVSLVFFAFISFLALKEYLSMIPTRRVEQASVCMAPMISAALSTAVLNPNE